MRRASVFTSLTRITLKVVIALAALVLAVAAGFAAQAFWRLPDLERWHTVRLASEFHAGDAAAPTTFDAYLVREAQLFAELRSAFYSGAPVRDGPSVERYVPGSLSAEIALNGPGNHSADRPPDGPVRGLGWSRISELGGEWTGDAETHLKAKLLCGACYDAAKAFHTAHI